MKHLVTLIMLVASFNYLHTQTTIHLLYPTYISDMRDLSYPDYKSRCGAGNINTSYTQRDMISLLVYDGNKSLHWNLKDSLRKNQPKLYAEFQKMVSSELNEFAFQGDYKYCTKQSYDCIIHNIQKFQVICEYYTDEYNLEINKIQESNDLVAIKKAIDDSVRNAFSGRYDSILTQRDARIKQLETEYNLYDQNTSEEYLSIQNKYLNAITKLKNERDAKINALTEKEYLSKSLDIEAYYDNKIRELKNQMGTELFSLLLNINVQDEQEQYKLKMEYIRREGDSLTNLLDSEISSLITELYLSVEKKMIKQNNLSAKGDSVKKAYGQKLSNLSSSEDELIANYKRVENLIESLPAEFNKMKFRYLVEDKYQSMRQGYPVTKKTKAEIYNVYYTLYQRCYSIYLNQVSGLYESTLKSKEVNCDGIGTLYDLQEALKKLIDENTKQLDKELKLASDINSKATLIIEAATAY